MYWILLVIAGILEIGWAWGLKAADGFTRPGPTIFTVICLIASMGAFGIALRGLPLGTAYAVWTGIGAAGTAVLGMALYGEAASAARLGCILLIILGIAGLKLVSDA
jgi:quaternary ammonium compound-resistance protein SugE